MIFGAALAVLSCALMARADSKHSKRANVICFNCPHILNSNPSTARDSGRKHCRLLSRALTFGVVGILGLAPQALCCHLLRRFKPAPAAQVKPTPARSHWRS